MVGCCRRSIKAEIWRTEPPSALFCMLRALSACCFASAVRPNVSSARAAR